MKGKKWVFIFDQINKIFCKPQNREAKDASGLAFPFSLISTVRKVGRIASVISASANNEISYKEYHGGFFAYEHPLRMTNDELLLAFGRSAAFPDAADIINNENVESVIEATSGIPLYAQKYAKNPYAFENEILESVSHSLDGLRKSTHFDNILEAIISSLLLTTVPNWRYDKKFLIQETLGFASWRYTPLFPAVAMAYRSELWKDLMKYVEAKESILLEVCRSPETTNDTRGRLFELMAIRRCQTYGIQDFPVRDSTLTILPGSQLFRGKKLPRLSAQSTRTSYVPLDPNFPAIDWIWVHGDVVIGVRAHVTKHPDVVNNFWGMCINAGWLQEFQTILLVYLSPEDETVHLVSRLVDPPHFQGRIPRGVMEFLNGDAPSGFRVFRRAISRRSVSCLQSLMWPDGCSLLRTDEDRQ